ncbi:hypothetical protein Acsp04_61500 [Actinomadura sp. NBRC 104425]|nr:hypothetical protein Acsp04_61500 [Actinomadura sp. NBRC 104425]
MAHIKVGVRQSRFCSILSVDVTAGRPRRSPEGAKAKAVPRRPCLGVMDEPWRALRGAPGLVVAVPVQHPAGRPGACGGAAQQDPARAAYNGDTAHL